MREIIFRAWDGKKMIYPKGEKYVIQFNGTIGKFDDKIEMYNTVYYALMQSTGLKDRHGKEIYEGDIIRHPDCGNLVVHWDKNCAGFWLDGDLHHTQIFPYSEYSEVIGNIYENEDLIP